MLATLFPNNVRHGGHRFVGTCLQTERKKKKSERKLAHKLEIKKEYNNNRNGNRKKERSTRLFIDSF